MFLIRAPPRTARRRDGVKGPKNGNRGDSTFGGYDRQERQMFPAVCATCGKETTVPFRPSGDKPVYCCECFVTRYENYF